MEQVQSYLEQLDRQKAESVRQSVPCNDSKLTTLMRSLSTVNYSSYHQLTPAAAYSGCLVTAAAGKTSDDPSVYHADQLGSCLGSPDGTGAGGTPGAVMPMVGGSLKPEVDLSAADDECFSAGGGQHGAGVAYAPVTVDVHRAANADSSTCLHSRYTTNNHRCST